MIGYVFFSFRYFSVDDVYDFLTVMVFGVKSCFFPAASTPMTAIPKNRSILIKIQPTLFFMFLLLCSYVDFIINLICMTVSINISMNLRLCTNYPVVYT